MTDEENVLNFELKDFQVLEEFKFDETIVRPENIRFFTIDEQVNDAFDKFIPRQGRVSSFKIKQIKEEVDKIQKLYDQFIVPEEDTYAIREPSYGKNISWIHPVYQSDKLNPYSFADDWYPLFVSEAPGFYPRMLAALPKPYLSSGDATYPILTPTKFVDEEGKNPIIGLPNYVMTRKNKHEDGRFDIVDLPIEGTSDQIQIKGYFAEARPLEIPNPLPDHPFLKDNKEVFVSTNAPLSDIVPSLDAIITHALPANIRDPYGEGMKYLKIYDVTLADIPWSSWKMRFPQVEAITSFPKPAELPYPSVKEFEPPKELTQTYKTKYYPALSPRNWLMNQIDGGNLVAKMLLSVAGDVGIVNQAITSIGISEENLPKSTPLECELENISFNEFKLRGLYRNKTCIPLETILQERKQIGYKNRITWEDKTGEQILKQYLIELSKYQFNVPQIKQIPEQKTEFQEDSKLHKEVYAILADEKRFNDDKLNDIYTLLKDTPVSNHIYRDTVKDQFVVCEHTLELLGGAIDKDRTGFQDTWTAYVDGFRVCKYCGEQIVEGDLQEQDEFNEEGFRVIRAQELPSAEKAPSTHDLATFASGLRGLVSLFNLKEPAEDAFFLTMAVIQILPDVNQINAILTKLRALTAGIKPGVKGEKKVKGAMGLAALSILIQMHLPVLVPRRSFGSAPLMLNGYPRDADKPGEITIADSLLMALRKTFEASPTAFKGAASEFIRATLNERAEMRKQILTAISILLSPKFDTGSVFKNALIQAKAVRANAPVIEETVKSLIPAIPQPPANAPLITNYEECPSGRPFWTTSKPPRYRQVEVKLLDRVPSTDAPLLQPSSSVRDVPAPVNPSEIRKNLSIKVSKDIKLPIKEDWRRNIQLANHLASVFRISFPELDTLDIKQGDALLENITRGYVLKILNEIEQNPQKIRKLQDLVDKSDVSLYILLTELEDDKKNTNTLRARERVAFLEAMRKKSDIDREATKELLKIGNIGRAAYIIVNKDREDYAKELEENILEERNLADMPPEREGDDVGVGLERQNKDQDDIEPEAGADNGDYGDYEAEPINEGRDPYFPDMYDPNDPI